MAAVFLVPGKEACVECLGTAFGGQDFRWQISNLRIQICSMRIYHRFLCSLLLTTCFVILFYKKRSNPMKVQPSIRPYRAVTCTCKHEQDAACTRTTRVTKEMLATHAEHAQEPNVIPIPISLSDEQVREHFEAVMWHLIARRICPRCYAHHAFQQGPRGGESSHVRCSECAQEYWVGMDIMVESAKFLR